MAVGSVYISNIEFNAIKREVKNGMVSPMSYLFANSVLQVPFMFLLGLSSLGISAYAIIDYREEAFPKIWLLYSLGLYSFEAIAQTMAIAFDNPIIGMLQFMSMWFSAFLFCGIFLPVDSIVWPFRILSYVLPYQYAFRSQIHAEFIDQTFSGAMLCDPLTVEGCNSVDGRLGPEDGWMCDGGATVRW